MIPAVASALDQIVGAVVALRHAKGAGRAYELYIMSGLAEELARRNHRVIVQRSDGTSIRATDADRRFIQRGGAPTGVCGASEGANNPSSFLFTLSGSSMQWEIWNGVKFIGRSDGTHEIDIAIVPHEVGVALRAMPKGGIPGGRPVISIECKDVGQKGESDEIRAFVARMYDLTILGVHSRWLMHHWNPVKRINPGPTSPDHDPYRTFLDSNCETLNIVARRSGFRAGAITMCPLYRVQPHGPVVPGSAADRALIQVVCDWIEANLV